MTAWRRMEPSDLDAVHALADRIHLDHPEDRAVLAERQRLFAPGCHVLDRNGTLQGYAISHPAMFGKPPSLNTLLGNLPAEPTTFYLHDVAISPPARSGGAAQKIVELLVDVARGIGLDNLTLVAVNGSQPFWERQGFEPMIVPELARALASYGDAVFMMRKVGKTTAETPVARRRDV